MQFESEAAIIHRISDEIRSISDTIVVLLVVNSKMGAAPADDYDRFSVVTEYFSEAELKELTGGFESIGCKVDCSNGEREFNERLVRGDFAAYDHLQKVVYHSTGGGTGKCRSSFIPALCSLYQIQNCSNDAY